MKTIKVFTDGGARGNPGPAGIGVHIPGVGDYKKFLGKKTNNQAEYEAVVLAFQKLDDYKNDEINFYLDSELVVKQLNGEYKVKDVELGKLFVKIWNAKAGFKKVTFTHIRREKNKIADKLANEAMDEAA